MIVIVATVPISVIVTVVAVIVVVARIPISVIVTVVAIRVIAAVVIIFTTIYTPMMSAVDASNAPGC
jgi:hypothetical protein